MKRNVLKMHVVWLALIPLFFLSCKKDVYTSDVFIKKQWKVDLSPANMVPALTSRTDHAVAMFFLMSNKELHYDIYFDKVLNNGDTPGVGHLYLGAIGQAGTVFIDLKTTAFDAMRETKGKIAIDDATSTKLQTEKIYLQISSTQQQLGLVRGQLN
jgi:hypothetical protein